jgi:Neocarzinostatin family
MRHRIGISAIVVALALSGALVAVEPAGAAESHVVTVTPSTGLSDGQTVTVSGAGFVETPALNDWAVTQCTAAILSEPITLITAINDCDATTEPAVFAHADAAGNLSTSFVVRKSLTTGIGTGTGTAACGQAPNDCAILVAQFAAGFDFVGAATPISFGSPPRTLKDCFREFRGDHQHRVRYRFRRLLLCISTLRSHHRPD